MGNVGLSGGREPLRHHHSGGSGLGLGHATSDASTSELHFGLGSLPERQVGTG